MEELDFIIYTKGLIWKLVSKLDYGGKLQIHFVEYMISYMLFKKNKVVKMNLQKNCF